MLKRNEPKVFNELGCAAYDVALTAGVTLPEATGPVPLRKCLKAFSNPETVRAKVQSKKLAVGLASAETDLFAFDVSCVTGRDTFFKYGCGVYDAALVGELKLK